MSRTWASAAGQVPPATIEWDRYRKCPVCASEIGEPCLELSGLMAGSGPVEVPADWPHGGRLLRKVASRG